MIRCTKEFQPAVAGTLIEEPSELSVSYRNLNSTYSICCGFFSCNKPFNKSTENS